MSYNLSDIMPKKICNPKQLHHNNPSSNSQPIIITNNYYYSNSTHSPNSTHSSNSRHSSNTTHTHSSNTTQSSKHYNPNYNSPRVSFHIYCRAVGCTSCTRPNQRHYCKKCGDNNSDHLSSNCTKKMIVMINGTLYYK